MGLGIDEGTEDGFRNVLYADLPTGQVSWHIEDDHLFLFDFVAPYEGEFDGHTTTEKYQRLVRYRPDAKRRKSRAKAG